MIAAVRAAADFKLRHWAWFALAASVFMLGAAYYFQYVDGLAPCILCLRQRWAYRVAIAISLIGVIGGFTPWRHIIYRIACVGLIGAFGAGLYLAGWHAGAEYGWWDGPQACAASGTGQVTVDSIAEMLAGNAEPMPSCEVPVWWFLGLTMAGWNFIISAGLMIGSALAALKGRKA